MGFQQGVGLIVFPGAPQHGCQARDGIIVLRVPLQNLPVTALCVRQLPQSPPPQTASLPASAVIHGCSVSARAPGLNVIARAVAKIVNRPIQFLGTSFLGRTMSDSSWRVH